MAIFKCMTCGNLHGAAVESCGMCHSGAIEQLHEEPTTPGTLPPPALPPEFAAGAEKMIDEGLIDFLHSGSTFFRAGADWFRSNTDTKRDPLTPADKWPATSSPSSPTVDGPKKP